MRILPRSRWGRALAVVGVVLVGVDVASIFVSVYYGHRGTIAGWGGGVGVVGGSLATFVINRASSEHGVHWEAPDARIWLVEWSSLALFRAPKMWMLAVPFWHLYLPAIAGTILLERRHARKAHTPNTCPHCHYNLAGLPPRGACPECGRTQA